MGMIEEQLQGACHTHEVQVRSAFVDNVYTCTRPPGRSHARASSLHLRGQASPGRTSPKSWPLPSSSVSAEVARNQHSYALDVTTQATLQVGSHTHAHAAPLRMQRASYSKQARWVAHQRSSGASRWHLHATAPLQKYISLREPTCGALSA